MPLIGRTGGLVLVMLCAFASKGRPEVHKPPLPVRIQPVQTGSPELTQRFSANIEPGIRVDLAWKVGGYIDEILVVKDDAGRSRLLHDGDMVHKGQVLARVRDADYQVRLAQARGGLAQAEAAMSAARQDHVRATTLRAEQAIPQAIMDGAKAKLDGTQGAVDLAAAYVRQAQLAVDDTALHAPINGVVLKRLIEVGSLVGPGSGGFVLADNVFVKAVLGVPDSALSRFPIGAKVPIRVDAIDASAEGLVTRVSPFADPRSRVFDVEVSIPNPTGVLKPGMVASATTRKASEQAVMQVPLACVRRPPGAAAGYAVFVVDDSGGTPVARVRPVVIGEVRGGSIEILDGVREGERVVVSGSALAVDGGAVAIIP